MNSRLQQYLDLRYVITHKFNASLRFLWCCHSFMTWLKKSTCLHIAYFSAFPCHLIIIFLIMMLSTEHQSIGSTNVSSWSWTLAPTPVQEGRPKPPTKRSQPALLKNIIISVKPQAKKPKVEAEAKPAPEERPSNGHGTDQKQPDDTKSTLGSLVAYDDDDESGEDDDWQWHLRVEVWIPKYIWPWHSRVQVWIPQELTGGDAVELQPVGFPWWEAKLVSLAFESLDGEFSCMYCTIWTWAGNSTNDIGSTFFLRRDPVASSSCNLSVVPHGRLENWW